MSEKTVTYGIPAVSLRNLVIFPEMVLHFDVGREQSINAVNAAMEMGNRLFLVAQRDPEVEEPEGPDLYTLGVVATVRQIVTLPGSENLRVIVEGDYRAELLECYSGNYLTADIEEVKTGEVSGDTLYIDALLRHTRDLFTEYTSLTPKVAPDVLLRVVNDDSPGGIADYITSVIAVDFKKKQEILEAIDPVARLELLCTLLKEEIKLLELELKISEKLEGNLDDTQKEYYLREKMRVISDELDGDDSETEIEAYREKIKNIENISEKSREKLLKEVSRLKRMGGQMNAEAAVVRNYLDTALELPWDKKTEDNLDLEKARKVLDRDHFGLKEVKDRIIELLAVKKMAPDIKGQIICLAGPPGVGKTSIVRSLAEAMGREYVRVSLGGVRDEAEIRGHRKTYIGAMPGRVITALNEAGTNNPLILFDEIDKMSSDMRGDPASAMLEVLDGEQNNAFVDHYLEIPFDLSQILFITTANDISSIPAPLLDRMEVIELYSYTAEEKFNIAKKHLIPKAVKAHGLTGKQISFTDGAIHHIISDYTREAGVRLLEKKIQTICRKVDLKVVGASDYTVKIKVSNLKEFLGVPKYKEEVELEDRVGVTNGLAWTSVGGTMLQVEAAAMEGKGNLELTGSLGDVMKESAKAAVSYLRMNADTLGLDADFYKNKDIHIHVPEGAVPKDGPSAGVTIATSLLSALTGNPVKGHVAMTGEISLTGRVMPIGGLREKTMAAYKAGIDTVLIPKDNEPDLELVDSAVKENVRFIPVTGLGQVLSEALIKE